MRFVRLSRGGDPRYAFAWPDQPTVAMPRPGSDAGPATADARAL
ncbi:hypothetical protein ABT133_19005 [Streptomyces sp. NPDC001835]